MLMILTTGLRTGGLFDFYKKKGMIIRMAYTYLTSVTYKATGEQTNFAIPFDYLRAAFVYVDVDGVNLTSGFEVNNRVLVFAEAPAEGSLIKIYRQTPTKRLVSWADASILKARDMEITGVQELHILEEQQDNANVVLSTADNILDDSKATLEQAKKLNEDAAISASEADKSNQEVQEASTNIKNIYNIALVANRPVMYNNVADMKADIRLRKDMTACTLGYYEPNDGGAGTYIIRAKQDSDVDDGGSLHEVKNGCVAELINNDGFINAECFGIRTSEENASVNDEQILLLIQYCSNQGKNVKFTTDSIYYFKKPIILTKKIKIFGANVTTLQYDGTGTFLTILTNYVNLENLFIRGNKKNNGLILGDFKNKKAASYFVSNNCSFVFFDTAVTLNYCWICSFTNVDIGKSSLALLTQSANNINFFSCNIGESTDAIRIEGGNILFDGLCCESNTNSWIKMLNGQATLIEPYFETKPSDFYKKYLDIENGTIKVVGGIWTYPYRMYNYFSATANVLYTNNIMQTYIEQPAIFKYGIVGYIAINTYASPIFLNTTLDLNIDGSNPVWENNTTAILDDFTISGISKDLYPIYMSDVGALKYILIAGINKQLLMNSSIILDIIDNNCNLDVLTNGEFIYSISSREHSNYFYATHIEDVKRKQIIIPIRNKDVEEIETDTASLKFAIRVNEGDVGANIELKRVVVISNAVLYS